MFRRRKMKKTDYVQRLSLLRSSLPRLVVRRSLNNVHAQIISFDENGDKVLVETFSKELRKYGWHGHCGSVSAAYLTGLIIGARAKKLGVGDAILDIGLHVSIKGSSLYAAALGARDAGLNIPIGKEILPSKERITGKHVADYAVMLKKENPAAYKKQFSACLKNNLEPEKITEHFDEVKSKIMNELGIMTKKKEVVA